jgi:hypothetical protein
MRRAIQHLLRCRKHAAEPGSADCRERLSPHERVKICKTFALALTRRIATVDAGFVQFCDAIGSGSYLTFPSGRTFGKSIQ